MGTLQHSKKGGVIPDSSSSDSLYLARQSYRIFKNNLSAGPLSAEFLHKRRMEKLHFSEQMVARRFILQRFVDLIPFFNRRREAYAGTRI